MYYHDDGKLKFSGWIRFWFHDNIIEFEDYDIIYETEENPGDVEIEYDVLEQFKETDYYKVIEDTGKYYLYFEGDVHYSHEETMDGTEYDAEVNMNYFRVGKSEVNP